MDGPLTKTIKFGALRQMTWYRSIIDTMYVEDFRGFWIRISRIPDLVGSPFLDPNLKKKLEKISMKSLIFPCNLIDLVSDQLEKTISKSEICLPNLIVWSDGRVVHQGITSGEDGPLTLFFKFGDFGGFS